MSSRLYLSSTDYDCYIAIKGKNVPVYAASSCGGSLHGYIESVEGAQFTVHVVAKGDQLNEYDRAIGLDVDGTRHAFHKAPNHLRGTPISHPDRKVSFEGQRCGATTIKPFHFARVELTDDERSACDAKTLRNLGKIALCFYRVRVIGSNDQPVYCDFNTAVVHENAKRMQTHQVKLGEARQASSKSHLRYKWIDSRDSPYRTFTFEYMSRESLEAKGLVAPLSSSQTSVLSSPVRPRVNRRSAAAPSPPSSILLRPSATITSRNTLEFSSPANIKPRMESSPILQRELSRRTSPDLMPPPPPKANSTPRIQAVQPQIKPERNEDWMKTPLRIRELQRHPSPQLSPLRGPSTHSPRSMMGMNGNGSEMTPLSHLKNENRKLEIELEGLKQKKLKEELEKMRSSFREKENELEKRPEKRKGEALKRERVSEVEGSCKGEDRGTRERAVKRKPFQVIIVD